MDIRALSYVIIDSTNPSQWAGFGSDVMGMMARQSGQNVFLKMDERAARIIIQPGPINRYTASGWEMADRAAFNAARAKLEAHSVEWHQATADELALRHVHDMIWFNDPSGNRHELALGYITDFARFISPVGVPRFITDPMGLGHMVLPAPNFDATYEFMVQVMGFGLADILIHSPADNIEQRIHFMHCANGRHHSIALFEGEAPSGCVHLMVEVDSMDEVGRAMDRMKAHNIPLMATLGRHVNDQMTSFYMASPAGFAIEYGYGGRVVDWDQHTIFESTSVSLWGHDFSVGFQSNSDETSNRTASQAAS